METDSNAPFAEGSSCCLINAVRSRQTELVKELLRRGADINKKGESGRSALAFASQEGYTDIVNILLHNDASIENRDNDGRTSLMLAAVNGQTDVARALVSAGADVNTQRNDGDSALGIASRQGHINVVNILLNRGAQIESRDNLGRTPLYFAAGNGRADVVHALVSAGAEVNTQRADGVSALSFAVRENETDVVEILLKYGADTNRRDNGGYTPLYIAARDGRTKVIDQLLDRGADVDAFINNGYSPVCIAAQQGHKDAVQTLIERGANCEHLEGESTDPLCRVALKCTHNVTDILRLLMKNISCISPPKYGLRLSALMNAAHRGRMDIVRVLVEHGADMYDRDFDNMLPIDIASYNGHVDIVQFITQYRPNSPAIALRCSTLHPSPSAVHVDCHRNTAMHLTTDLQAMISLLENGADVDAENVDGLRPIHCAVRTERAELVELLINHGANVDAADVFGNRPLHEAVCHWLRVVQLLVQRGANVNVQNINGKTPLHVAVERQQSDVIVFLLNQDSDVGLTDVWRNTPLHYFTSELFAVSQVAENVVKLLRKKSQHLFIRNAVGVSASMHITTLATHAATLSNEHMTRAHKINVYSREKLDADCYGNTPLHHAVGVYGRFKIYKISINVEKTVELLVKRGADINGQNQDGLTPLHVARGEQAINACLQHAGDQSFTITDKRGRNFWHLLFLTRSQNETELGKTIRPVIVMSDAKYSVDDLNRTPLHYACMHGRNPWIAEWNWLAKEFIEQFSGEHINKQDRFGRTALHYAAIGSSIKFQDLLKKMKADDSIQDNYHKTSDDYAQIRLKFGTLTSQLRLTNSSSFIASHRRDISACVQNCFADSSDIVKECKAKLHETVQEVSGFRDKAAYVLNVWHGCRYDNIEVTVALQQDGDQRLCNQNSTTNDNESSMKLTTVFAAIETEVHNAMEELAKAITEYDRHLFACEVIRVGSTEEKTKIGCCDEFDYNFVLTNLSSICEVCYSPESPPGFVLLKASTPVYDKALKDLFDENGILNTRIVKFKFETLAKQVLLSARFCDRTGFEFTDADLDNDLDPPPGNTAAKLHTQIKLIFTKPVNEFHVPRAISVDLIPVLRINEWWPDNAPKIELCTAGDCLIVFTQPHIMYPWITWTQPHGYISFARAESRLLRQCHPVAKAAYMVVKRMSKHFCQHEFFSSHTIKMALLWCLNKKDLMKYRSFNGSDEVRGCELLCLVQNILRRLLCFVTCYLLLVVDGRRSSVNFNCPILCLGDS